MVALLRYGLVFTIYAFLGLLVLLINQDLRKKTLASKTSGRLVIKYPGSTGWPEGKWFPLGEVAFIGQDPRNNIVIAGSGVSSWHAVLNEVGEALVVVDLGSADGTRVNGKTINQPVRLKTGDTITVGSTTFELTGWENASSGNH